MIDLLLSSKWIFLFYIRKYSKSGEEWVIRITRLSNNSKFQNFKKRKLRNDILDESELWLDRCGIKTSIVSILTIFDRVNCEARWLESGKSIKVSCTCLSMGQKHEESFFFLVIEYYLVVNVQNFETENFVSCKSFDFNISFFSSSSRIVSICLSIKKKKNTHT